MRGRIVYDVTLDGTPAMPPATGTLNAGDTQTIDFAWLYSRLDPVHQDVRNISKSVSGAVDVRLLATTRTFRIEVPRVMEARSGVNHYAILTALNDEIALGTALNWYPDYANYPTEYFSCVGNKRVDPVREGARFLWTFKFDLMVLASVQAASTVPSYVML